LLYSGVMDPRRDARLRDIAWRDLLPVSRIDIASELMLSLPWLAASLAAAGSGWYALALPASFMFFLTGLRQAHGAQHRALGLSPAATEWVLAALSLLMLGSMHAVQVNHLRHHRLCLRDEDVEARSARLPAWRALCVGPLFPVRLHRAALRVASARQRRWIRAELAANAIAVGAAWWLAWPTLRYHLLAMCAGQCLTAFFAVWTVHHDCEPGGVFARTLRHRGLSWLSYDMFYHLEHHLFPAVPTRRLRELARRLDAAMPDLAPKLVLGGRAAAVREPRTKRNAHSRASPPRAASAGAGSC
jgi:fatty acid desaturase